MIFFLINYLFWIGNNCANVSVGFWLGWSDISRECLRRICCQTSIAANSLKQNAKCLINFFFYSSLFFFFFFLLFSPSHPIPRSCRLFYDWQVSLEPPISSRKSKTKEPVSGFGELKNDYGISLFILAVSAYISIIQAFVYLYASTQPQLLCSFNHCLKLAPVWNVCHQSQLSNWSIGKCQEMAPICSSLC